MNFEEVVKTRQSVRAYSDKAVEKEKIIKCIEAARIAPSACNSQPWTFIVVDNPQLKNEVAEACKSKVLGLNKFADQAPVMIVIVREASNFSAKFGGLVKSKTYNLIDIGIATDHFCLQATEQELGTCIMGWFDEKKIKKLLSIPKSKRIDLVISLGYPKTEEIRTKIRKTTEEMCKFNKY